MKDTRRVSIIRHVVFLLLLALSTMLTVKNNIHIDNGDKMNQLQYVAVYLFKFSPMIILSALEGVIPGMVSCAILFVIKTAVNKELAFTTAVYVVGAALAHYFSMAGMFSKKLFSFC